MTYSPDRDVMPNGFRSRHGSNRACADKQWKDRCMRERSEHSLDLSPFLRQTVKTQNSANGIKMPFKGGMSHGFVSTAVHQGVQAGGDPAVGEGGVAGGGGTSV